MSIQEEAKQQVNQPEYTYDHEHAQAMQHQREREVVAGKTHRFQAAHQKAQALRHQLAKLSAQYEEAVADEAVAKHLLQEAVLDPIRAGLR